MKITKALIAKSYRLLSFYTAMVFIILFGFLISGKSVEAYTHPSEAAFYTKQRNYSVVLTSKTYSRNETENKIETLSRELKLSYEHFKNSSDEADHNSYIQLMQAFIPIGLPNEGIITSEVGRRVNPIGENIQEHAGTDIAMPEGTPVYANANGLVVESKYSDSYGYVIELQHIQGYSTVYAHNSELVAAVGDYVLKGDVIALSGNTGNSTGPHLHYEIRLAGQPITPLGEEALALIP